MSIADSLLPEFDLEFTKTRKMLERVPEDKLAWQANAKSRPIGWVANHLAEIPGWVAATFGHASLDVDPPGGPKYVSPAFKTRAEILQVFDDNVARGRAALAAAPDEEFSHKWSLLRGGQPIFTMLKAEVLRFFVLNHTIHHRAILSVYYRLCDIPVPGMYGPSADEGWG